MTTSVSRSPKLPRPHPSEVFIRRVLTKKPDLEAKYQEFIGSNTDVNEDFAKQLYADTGISVGFWLNCQKAFNERLAAISQSD